ncbi:hypothetical protein FQN49_001384 [Arthroderma sp. PD_2]|nr:hypothetical protein FQN49_001384 [Arthroderma sp. PD_2]
MSDHFGLVIRSKPFTFLIGHEKIPFVVHPEAIASQSAALDALINGDMIEAQSRTVSWPDVDQDTFVRFCEFCYKDDYSEPDWQTDASVSCGAAEEEEEPKEEVEEEEDQGNGWGWNVYIEPSIPKREFGRDDTWNFKAPDVALNLPQPYRGQGKTPAQCYNFHHNSSPEQDFTPVFLAHAKLYVLADKYGVARLKATVIYKLHRILQDFMPYNERIGDIVELVRFTYSDENTLGRDAGGNDDLRKLVARYAAFQADVMRSSEAFMELLQTNGELLKNFLTEIGTHTCSLADELAVWRHHRCK